MGGRNDPGKRKQVIVDGLLERIRLGYPGKAPKNKRKTNKSGCCFTKNQRPLRQTHKKRNGAPVGGKHTAKGHRKKGGAGASAVLS